MGEAKKKREAVGPGSGGGGGVKLQLPRVLDHFRTRALVAHGYAKGPRVVSGAESEPFRALLPKMEAAQKFIFDSGTDRDGETRNAILDTAFNMVEAGRFHLPFGVCWIEDFFEPEKGERPVAWHLYLATEEADCIRIRIFHATLLVPTWLVAYEDEATIDLTTPRKEFFFNGEIVSLEPVREYHDGTPRSQMKAQARVEAKQKLSEAVYAIKKFVVTLATPQAIRERVSAPPQNNALPEKWRSYEHTIVRVPLDMPERGDGVGNIGFNPPGKKRRKHLVRGYMWGKNTRSPDEQRWIAPFWRGDGEKGAVEHDHYVVAAQEPSFPRQGGFALGPPCGQGGVPTGQFPLPKPTCEAEPRQGPVAGPARFGDTVEPDEARR